MSNDFRNLERDLRAFAKRNRNVTYTKGLLMTFLITGTISLSTWGAVDTTQAARQGVNVAITDMRQTFSRAREENKALLKDANLELIQLMEQGDHVVKSPWSSWQFGVNTFINNHKGSYKGKGDKVKDVKYEREQGFDKYQYQGSAGLRSEYGNTTKLGGVREPNAALPVFASLTPLTPQLKDANLSMNVNLGTLPAFEPATVKEPTTPVVTPPKPQINIKLDITSGSRGSSERVDAFGNTSESAMQSVAVKGGKIDIKRNNTSYVYDVNNVSATVLHPTLTPNSAITGFTSGTPYTQTITGNLSNAFFQSSGYSFGTTLNQSDIDYNVGSYPSTTHFAELIHQDVHGGKSMSDVNTALTTANITGLLPTNFSDIYNTNVYDTVKTKTDSYNVFANAGKVVIEGDKAIFSHSYHHANDTHGIVMNAGDIIINKRTDGNPETQHAVFLVSEHVRAANPQQHFYNSGNITTNTDNTAMAIFVPTEGSRKRFISVTNKGNITLNGDNSAGIFPNNGAIGVNLHLNFSDATSAGTQTVLTGHDESSNNGKTYNTLTGGIIDKTTARANSKAMVINGKSSAGLYLPNKNSFVNGQFAVDVQTKATTDAEGSVGIYSADDVDLQGHYIKLGGSKNIGVYPVGSAGSSADIYLGKGSIELNGGSNNTGIAVKDQKGRVYSESEMVLEGGTGNIAIYAKNHTTSTTNDYDVTVKSIETDTTAQKDSLYIYAEAGAKVKVDRAGGLNVKAEGESGAAYAKGANTLIEIEKTAMPTTENIVIDGKGTQESFGLFASDGGVIKASKNNIKVENAGVGVAAVDTNSIVDLDQGKLHYSGNGYALYAKNGGKVKLTNGDLSLAGKATGFSVDASSTTTAVDLNNTIIDVQSNDVTLMNLSNATGVNTLNTSGLATQLLGFANINPSKITPGSLAYTYKYAAIDGSKINVNSNIDKANTTTGSDSEVFTRRILLQNSIIDVNAGKTVKAELNTADLAGIDPNLTAPVGLAISASQNSKAGTTTTGIDNNGTVIADRTDAGQAGIGLYVNYGYVNNNSTGIVNVEKSGVNAPNDNAIGIYGTNSTVVNNDGQVNVGGQKSIGILGLSYRLNPTTGAVVDPSTESYYANNPGTYGIVDIKNNASGTITMDDDGAIGMFVKNNSTGVANAADRRNETQTNATNAGTITINGSNNSIGMGSDNGTLTNDTTGTINVNGTVSAGMYGTNTSKLVNKGTINIANSTVKNESIGIFTDDKNTTIETSGTINTGTSNYGIYGKNVSMTGGAINVGDNGVGVYSTGPNVNLSAGTISVGNNNAVGVYIADDATTPAPTTVTGNVSMTVGDNDSFGYMITSTKAPVNLTTGAGTTTTVGERSVYIYSGAPAGLGGTITNNTNISTTKNNGYGIYSSQNVVNNGNINLTSGVGNIGIYSTEGHARNTGTIDVGSTNLTNEEYGIGMATGYYDRATGSISNQGTIENTGVINVTQDNSIGMYAAGAGSQAINRGTINLSGDKTTGMYIDQNATGINYGTIQTVASGSKIKGVVVVNGGIIKNYGTINVATPDGIGIYKDATGVSSVDGQDTDPATGVTGVNTSSKQVYLASATDEKIEGTVHIKVPPKANPTTVTVNGVSVPIVGLDTNAPTATATDVIVTDPTGTTTLNLAAAGFANTPNTSNATSLGMYVDTSGINYTNPINGLSNLVGLTDIDLVFGTEATKYTNAKAIQLGNNILNPYNNALSTVVSTGTVLNVNSSSLTWLAQPIQSTTTGLLDTVYLVKVPYTDFVSSDDSNTYNFLDGLEQRYDANDLSSREKLLFNKLNDLGKGEAHIFAQAVNEMKGYQYSNVQQRINQTGNLLDKEFEYLYDQWETKSKQSNKLKVFGMRDEYTTNTAGIIDTTSNAYGVAYLHEDETVKLGDTTGWYAGIVNNRFKFKDLGGSRENQTMLKLGIFKSTAFDDNNSLNWTIAGDIFGGIHDMKRRYWIVDDVFSADSNYYSYGVGLKNEISKTFRTGEKTFIRPYANLELEYGRMSDIKEKTGEMRLEVKGNDYFSVQPEVGVEFKYKNKFGKRSTFITSLGLAYENELGRVGKVDNKARVGYTNAGWYNLVNERDNRRGNFKADLNLGIENTRVGFTANLGYDSVGKNIRGGLGIRAIY